MSKNRRDVPPDAPRKRLRDDIVTRTISLPVSYREILRRFHVGRGWAGRLAVTPDATSRLYRSFSIPKQFITIGRATRSSPVSSIVPAGSVLRTSLTTGHRPVSQLNVGRRWCRRRYSSTRFGARTIIGPAGAESEFPKVPVLGSRWPHPDRRVAFVAVSFAEPFGVRRRFPAPKRPVFFLFFIPRRLVRQDDASVRKNHRRGDRPSARKTAVIKFRFSVMFVRTTTTTRYRDNYRGTRRRGPFRIVVNRTTRFYVSEADLRLFGRVWW